MSSQESQQYLGSQMVTEDNVESMASATNVNASSKDNNKMSRDQLS